MLFLEAKDRVQEGSPRAEDYGHELVHCRQSPVIEILFVDCAYKAITAPYGLLPGHVAPPGVDLPRQPGDGILDRPYVDVDGW